MARRIRKWLTPDSFETDNVCRSFNLPHWSLWSYIDGALAPLTDPLNWEAFGDMTPDEMAEIFSRVLYEFSESCMNCNELLECLYGSNQQFRMNPTTGELESSSDGGTTWDTNTSHDPRLISPRIGLDGAVDCDAAKFIIGYMQQFIDQIKDIITAGSGIVGLSAGIVAIVAGVLSIGTLTPLVVGLGSAVLGFTVGAIDAALTSDVYARLLCNIYCNLLGTTNVTAEMVENVKAQILEDESGVAETVLWNVVNFLGPVGLQNAVAMAVTAASVPANCNDCLCGEYCAYWNLGQTNGGFAHIAPFTLGTWMSGIGWRGTFFDNNSRSALYIDKNFADINITRVAIVYDKNAGGGSNNSAKLQLYHNGVKVAENVVNNNGADQLKEILYEGLIDRIVIDMNSGTSTATITVEELYIEGPGGQPFEGQDCA